MKFLNKYKIESTRLKNFDYSQNGVYFITICTKNRGRYFGKIIKGKMHLTNIGKIANQYWINIANHFNFVLLDEFVIMPDHMHGIIWINKSMARHDDFVKTHGDNNKNINQNINDYIETHHGGVVGTHNYASLPNVIRNNKFGPQSQNLASIIRSYKIAVKTFVNKNNIPFAWQPRYYDHVIKNGHELNRIRKYIINNPKNWLKK